MESLHHCTLNRKELKNLLQEKDLLHKAFIPEDGEVIEIAGGAKKWPMGREWKEIFTI